MVDLKMKEKRGKEVAGLVAGLTVEHATAFQDILGRLKRASDANSDAELADKLGLKRSSVSTAKTRKMIPPSWIINVSNLFNVSADWLIYGDNKQTETPKNQLGETTEITNLQAQSASADDIKKDEPGDDRHLRELLDAYKKIVSLQDDIELIKNKMSEMAEREALIAEREALIAEREALITEAGLQQRAEEESNRLMTTIKDMERRAIKQLAGLPVKNNPRR